MSVDKSPESLDPNAQLDEDDVDDGGMFDTDDGLKKDFWLHIEHASFTKDAKYNNGNTLLLKFEGKDPADNKDMSIVYSTGNGWGAKDSGKRAEHTESPERTKFNTQSKIGLLLARVKSNKAKGLKKALVARGGDIREAGIWTGLEIRFKEEPTESINPQTQKPVSCMLPVEFRESGSGGKAGHSHSHTAKKSAIPEDAKEALSALAASSSNQQEFMDAVFVDPSLNEQCANNDDLAAAVMSGAAFKELK